MEMLGCPGTRSGLLMRLGQSAFAVASIGLMFSAAGFSSYTAFCFLIASMALQSLWSLGLAFLDTYALWNKREMHNRWLIGLFVVGDCVTATLSLAAASSSAGVTILFVKDVHFCKTYPHFSCAKYQISVALAFISWFLVAMSSLVVFFSLKSENRRR